VRIAVVENMDNTHLGIVGRALDEAGADVELFRPWRDGVLPSGTHDHDGLIVLGGKQSALDDADYPYLPALAGVMRRFGDADKAVLGICLGGQLLARAYGGENILGSAKEFAWTPLDVTPEGAADPLFRGLGNRFESFHWHVDTFSLPDKAVRLVSGSAVANQCFRIGRAAYGMQFHFEAGVEVVEAWLTAFPAGSLAIPKSPRGTPRRRIRRAMPSRALSCRPSSRCVLLQRPTDTRPATHHNYHSA
jgi:GMP synthase (glutamine-hydrolysing)